VLSQADKAAGRVEQELGSVFTDEERAQLREFLHRCATQLAASLQRLKATKAG